MQLNFRVKVRVKRWKIDWADHYRQAMEKAWREPNKLPTHLPQVAQSYICPRCGMKWDGPMGYCCPHGQLCGVPVQRSQTIRYLNPRQISWNL